MDASTRERFTPAKAGHKITKAQDHAMVKINKIKMSRNSRTKATEGLDGLKASIAEIGLLQPIGVVKRDSGYEITNGNRRFLACSELGWSDIPAVIHNEDLTEEQVDIINLAENIQRRNISPIEVGKYIERLLDEGVTQKEIAAKLGVNVTFAKHCLDAYREVPKDFRDDVVIGSQAGGQKGAPAGKFSLGVTRAILSSRRKFDLKPEELKKLFTAAKGSDNFNEATVDRFASAIKSGKNPDKTVEKMVPINMRFFVTERHQQELEERYVQPGPFRTLKGLFEAILKGEKAVKVEILR